MILEQYSAWQTRCPETMFEEFLNSYVQDLLKHATRYPNEGSMAKEIFRQIYQLQCCVEGLIEDQEFVWENVRKKNKKASAKRKSKDKVGQ